MFFVMMDDDGVNELWLLQGSQDERLICRTKQTCTSGVCLLTNIGVGKYSCMSNCPKLRQKHL